MDDLETAIACIFGFFREYQEGYFRHDSSGKTLKLREVIHQYIRDYVSWEDQITLCMTNEFARACYKQFLDEDERAALRIIS